MSLDRLIVALSPIHPRLVRFAGSLGRAFVPCVLVLAAFISGARAQPMGEVVVVPFGSPDLTSALQVTSLIESELADERVSLIPLHDARDRFTARSRPPQTASDSDLDVLAREARQAIEHVAFGRTAAAQKSVREVIARAERTLESLNRETNTARHILDACLSLVRTTLQTGRRDLALEQATRCRRLVPDLVPSEANHPAAVVGVLAEADNMLRRMRIGALSVRSTPESNCSVYLNGRHLGTTPFQLEHASAGDYRVQVECGRSAGRVHVVQLGDQAVSLLVDTQFDRIVASDPRLLLRYENRDQGRELAVAHAVQLGREIGADDVILVGVSRDRAELLRVHVPQQRLVGRASVPWTAKNGFARPALEAAITALAEARVEGEPSLEKPGPVPPTEVVEPKPPAPAEVEAPAPEPVAEAPAEDVVEPAPVESAPPSSPERRERRMRIAGYSLVATSAVLFAVGIGFDVHAQHLLDQLARTAVPDAASDPLMAARIGQRQSDYEHASNLRWIGIAAGGVGTAAAGLLTRPRGTIPWWGYLFGAGSVGLVVAGAVEVANNGSCDLKDDSGCRRPHDSAALGAILMTAAAPFLTVPVVQLFHPRRERGISLSSSPTYGGAQFSFSMRF